MSRDDLQWLLYTAKEFAHKDWCLSVPRPVKQVITNLVKVIEDSQPRTITTADELLALPEASVVLDHEGDVSQKRDGLWCGYETAPINSNKLARLASPFTVLSEPKL